MTRVEVLALEQVPFLPQYDSLPFGINGLLAERMFVKDAQAGSISIS